MSNKKLPLVCDPKQFAVQGYEFDGSVETASMSRLSPLCAHIAETLDICMKFSFDGEGYVVIRGQFALRVGRVCQRCCQPMNCTLTGDFSWVPVTDDGTAKQLPDCYEGVAQTSDGLNLIDIIEEEVLLNLPQVARHADSATCAYRSNASTTDTKKPFANLQQMLKIDS